MYIVISCIYLCMCIDIPDLSIDFPECVYIYVYIYIHIIIYNYIYYAFHAAIPSGNQTWQWNITHL